MLFMLHIDLLNICIQQKKKIIYIHVFSVKNIQNIYMYFLFIEGGLKPKQTETTTKKLTDRG